jgi:hypothetical protein
VTNEQAILTVESLWQPGSGFLWQLRQGRFDAPEFERALDTLSRLSLGGDRLPRRLVSLIWYIPLVMHWQTQRIQEEGGDAEAYVRAVAAMTNEVERILGVP